MEVIFSIIAWVLIGMVAGWLASTLFQTPRSGLVPDITLGVLGAIVGGVIFTILGIDVDSILGSIAMATAGAMVLLGIEKLLL